eukprot:jgi/Orpsp1_1/1190228/evm.model.d7180000077588.1
MFRFRKEPKFVPPPPEPKPESIDLKVIPPPPPPMARPMHFRALAFRDIGRSVGDLLGKDYPTNGIKLETRSMTSNGVLFTVNGTRDGKTGAISGEMKTKYHNKANGVSFTESWSSSNVLSSTVELFNTLSPGLKLEFNGTYNPSN